jgi:hypothetical protein
MLLHADDLLITIDFDVSHYNQNRSYKTFFLDNLTKRYDANDLANLRFVFDNEVIHGESTMSMRRIYDTVNAIISAWENPALINHVKNKG